MRRAVAVLIATLLTSSSAAAAPNAPDKQRLAVLEVTPHSSVGVEKDPSRADFLKLVADAIRQGASEATEGQPFAVMTRDAIQEIVANMDCGGDVQGTTSECTKQYGRTLQAHKVLGSELALVEGSWILKMELYDVQTEALLRLERVTANGQQELLTKATTTSAEMLRKGLNLRNFASGLDLRVPVVDLSKMKRQGLSGLNKDVELLFAKAQKLQNDVKASPEARRDAWCELAGMSENNRYIETARPACDGWRNYVQTLQTLRSSLAGDYDKIATVLNLEHIPAEEKKQLLTEFLETYQPIADDDRVKTVQRAQKQFLAGKPVAIKTLDQIEHEKTQAQMALQRQRELEQEQQRQKELEDAEAEREAAERKEKLSRVVGTDTGSRAVKPAFRLAEAILGTFAQLLAIPVGAVVAIIAIPIIQAVLANVFEQSQQNSTLQTLLIVGGVMGLTFLVAGVVVIAVGGGGTFFKPVKQIFFGLLMGGDVSVRPISASLHKVIGSFTLFCWLCAPFCVLDYALGLGQVIIKAVNGEEPEKVNDITDN